MAVSEIPRSQYYGRRSARRLTGSRIEILRTVLSKYETTLPVETLQSPTWLEIGFGSGEHLLALAKIYPTVNFIGSEPYLNGVAALVRALETNAITNVRIYPEDARLLLGVLPDASVERVYALFADPWPKARHNRRRIINLDTLDMLERVTTAEATLLVATDHPDLAHWYEETIATHPAFEIHPAATEGPHDRPTDWPTTRYEAKAIAAGRKPWYFKVRRRARLSC